MSFISRLYRGQTTIRFVSRRKVWFTASAVALIICALSIGLRGFNFGVEFVGGNSLQFPSGTATVSQVQRAATDSGVPTESVQQAGTGSRATFVVRTKVLPSGEIDKLTSTIANELGSKIQVKGRDLRASDISQTQVSASWGHDVTNKAVIALIVFLVAVSIFISVLFEWRLALGAIVGVLHDLVITAGVYSLVGFEVTTSTVVGLLTILGYSLYDNIVVYDKVRENTRGVIGAARESYSDAANRAVNQTLARSINTSLIALLPVAGLLFVGAGLLGVGTIKDLALVLFIGLAVGAYSSLFLATPIACWLKERQPEYVALRKRLAARAASRGDRGAPATAASAARRRSGTSPARAGSATATAVVDDDSRPPAGSADGAEHVHAPRTGHTDAPRIRSADGTPPPAKPAPGVRPKANKKRPQARRRR